MTEFPQIVDSILKNYRQEIQPILRSNLVGLYLRGSLATGDFEPRRSDIDLLAVTDQPMDQETFTLVKGIHDRLSEGEHPFAKRMEIAYIDLAAIRRWEPGHRHPTLGQGEELTWQDHGPNWLMERWVVREYGVTLFGPDPKTLIDPIDPAEIKAAACDRLQDWAEWAKDEDDPDWGLPRHHKAYAVETTCRALYTIQHGKLSSKGEAVGWALTVLPAPWCDLVRRSRTWLLDSSTDPSLIPEVRAFILWAATNPSLKASP